MKSMKMKISKSKNKKEEVVVKSEHKSLVNKQENDLCVLKLR